MDGLKELAGKMESIEILMEQKLAKIEEAQKNVGTFDAADKTALKNLTEEWAGMRSRIDKLDAAVGQAKGGASKKSYNDIFRDEISLPLLKIKESGGLRNASISLKPDVIKSMLFSNTITGEIPLAAQATSQVIYNPDYTQHVRNVLTGGSIGSNSIYYNQEKTIVDETAVVAEGDTKPESSITMERVLLDVVKIATSLRFSEEIMSDISFFTTYLATRFLKKLRIVEDAQFLYGSGTGGNMNGIFTQASTFYAQAGSILFLSDVISRSAALIRSRNYEPNLVMLNPLDYNRYIELQ